MNRTQQDFSRELLDAKVAGFELPEGGLLECDGCKYRELAEPVIGKAKTEALLKDLWTLEQRKDCQLDYSATVVNMKRA